MGLSGQLFVQPVVDWQSKSERSPLRVAVLVGRKSGFAPWELQLFDRLLADPRFELSALLVHPRGYGDAPPLFELVAGVDRRLFARLPAYQPTYFTDICEKTECIRLAERPSDGKADLPLGAMERLRLDLVLRLVPNGLAEETVAQLPFGEWSANVADAQSGRAEWCSFTETAAHAATIDASVYVRRGDGRPAEQIATAAFNPKFSAARNAAFLKEKTVLIITRELRRLADTRQIAASPMKSVPAPPPENAAVARYLAGLVRAAAARTRKELAKRAGLETAVWTLYSGAGTIEDFEPGSTTELPPARNSIKADPFLFQHNGRCYVFYENYAVGDAKAHIAVGLLKPGGIEPLGVAIESEGHLSFPFVFRSAGEIYLMPETHQQKRIEIWRCVKFPLEWELHATALEGCSAADSTLFRHRGKWWLLSNLSDHHAFEDHCSELYAFEVDGPAFSRIEPHRRNPVVMGSNVARNAGRVFARNGRLLRPSQNNAYGIYGYGLNIMEIEELTSETYRERCIRTIRPDFKPGLVGCHHFDASGGRYILDARLNS
ncbi:hypothetical protein [Chelativorans sp. AA-79]|uniref:glucosamine inositolphosphorylceramide transferase family protein n=1 Tax=Chelativorans sp. AA-79 TaxID=3028735 RepID=UPI0023F7F015|nr:hypothetical protein [Chelativorans sp. AA-79]WEX10485.1 hypothetical protein PVE73_05880 [Chelativorans sp. AA-79]